jgi:hypothetical protein
MFGQTVALVHLKKQDFLEMKITLALVSEAVGHQGHRKRDLN